MRKLLFAALTAIIFTTSAFAEGGKTINSRVKNSFAADFGTVENVEWSHTADYATATFVMNNKRTNAFYGSEGKLVGTSQAIAIDELPAAAKKTFRKKYADYTVTEAIHFAGMEETAYFVSVEKENKTQILKIANNQISVFK